ncbi:MAG: hypothetical protein M1835_000979 [Candelina submexicana]|nr:MAG: hypothetical protein M1835_000979 [Candelina submexicana]
MSSMRNAVQRRNHRERAQPLEREKWGTLEKHKDYSLRAKDFNEKKKRLKTLRQKAADRNPDEFYFGMMSSNTRNGGQKVADRGNKPLSQDVVRLLKTQDAGYLRTMIQKERKQREKLEQVFMLGDGEGASARVLGKPSMVDAEGKHTIFVDSREEQRSFDSKAWFDTDDKGLSRRFNRPRKVVGSPEDEDEDTMAIPKGTKQQRSRRLIDAELRAVKEERALRKKHRREQEARKVKLEALKARETSLMAAEQELDLQRAKMSNSVGGVNKAGIKWKVKQRKK